MDYDNQGKSERLFRFADNYWNMMARNRMSTPQFGHASRRYEQCVSLLEKYGHDTSALRDSTAKLYLNRLRNNTVDNITFEKYATMAEAQINALSKSDAPEASNLTSRLESVRTRRNHTLRQQEKSNMSKVHLQKRGLLKYLAFF